MKAWILPLLAVVTGTAVGATTSLLKYRAPDLILAGHQAVAHEQPLPVADAKPRAYLPSSTSYDFGVMARNEEMSHTFHVQNIGIGPLTLKVLDTTCKCTVGTLARDEIMAGETADVTLTWQALSYDREFRQSATIETSDQDQREIVFSVYGQVIQLARPDTPSITFSRLSRSEPRQFVVKVYGYRDDDLKIIAHQFTDSGLAKFFAIKTEPLPPAEWDDPEAKSGIRVTVDIQPGLPLGVVRQVVELHTNKLDIAPLTVGIDMTIISDISVLGGGRFNDETNVLTLGPVPKATGAKVKLHLMAKGRHRDQVNFTVAEIDPSTALRATFGEPLELNNGAVLMVPLTIEVPPNSPSLHRMGSKQGRVGRVVFNTQHPEIEQLEIKVLFVVQD